MAKLHLEIEADIARAGAEAVKMIQSTSDRMEPFFLRLWY
jgi:hypothetical protein